MTAFVYIIAVGGEDGPFKAPVKIGMTDDPERRLRAIRPNSPLGISYAFVQPVKNRAMAHFVEKRMHQEFDYFLLEFEWFSIDPETATEALKKIAEGLNI